MSDLGCDPRQAALQVKISTIVVYYLWGIAWLVCWGGRDTEGVRAEKREGQSKIESRLTL